MLHTDWRLLPANELVANASDVAKSIDSSTSFFVRPDSPLKPFSGRVVDVESLTLAKLDHGFYFEDESLPVIVAPLQEIGDEWRFVIAGKSVVAGSGYDPATREPIAENPDTEATAFATNVASTLEEPAEIYILDVCDCAGELRLLELNPFGGADLYACDPIAIVDAVSKIASA